MIIVECNDCLRRFQVGDELGGKVARCMCGALLRVHDKPVKAKLVEAPEPVQYAAPPQQHVQTIEKTGKKWKLMMLISGLVAVAACPLSMILAPFVESTFGATAAMVVMITLNLAFIVAVLVFIVAKIEAWWHHG